MICPGLVSLASTMEEALVVSDLEDLGLEGAALGWKITCLRLPKPSI